MESLGREAAGTALVEMIGRETRVTQVACAKKAIAKRRGCWKRSVTQCDGLGKKQAWGTIYVGFDFFKPRVSSSLNNTFEKEAAH